MSFSSSPPVLVQLDNVSKRYRLGQGRYQTLAEDLKRWLRHSPKRASLAAPTFQRVAGDYIWALRNASLEIRAGEAVGFVGPNGAGKSTTLKLIAGTISPFSGNVRIRGRVAPLIEVGQGIHFELTGRENIFLNGAILGMSRSEIRRKFDDIVSFAGLESFLDTPVKRYSSGMKARLAMGVALHVDPDLLLVDEVLAVGDMVFQNRCIDRMRDFRKRGVTIVYVSHDMTSVLTMCRRVVWVDDGLYRMDGPAEQVVTAFQGHEARRMTERWKTGNASGQDNRVIIDRSQILGSSGLPQSTFSGNDIIQVVIHYTALMPVEDLSFDIIIRGTHGYVTGVSQLIDNRSFRGSLSGSGIVSVRFRLPNLAPGPYQVTALGLKCYRAWYMLETNIGAFDVLSSYHSPNQDATAYFPHWCQQYSPVLCTGEWECTQALQTVQS
jgi:lipopolysaccharide transport system ATP-binding protein